MANKAIPPFQRQGDVGIIRIDAGKLPAGLKPKKDNALAYGEVTGHAHRLFSVDEEPVLIMEDKNGSLYINVQGELGANLYHGTDEQIARQRRGDQLDYKAEDIHEAQFFTKGVYEVRRQKEHDPYANAMRAVED